MWFRGVPIQVWWDLVDSLKTKTLKREEVYIHETFCCCQD